MKNLLKKFIRKFVIFLRYNPFNFAISLRRYFYKFLFKKSGASFNITDNVIINFPENISIGNRVSLHQFSILDAKSEIIIGDNVAIGSHVNIITSNHIFEKNNMPIKDQGLSSEKIVIGSNVWLGTRVTILKGVKIGNNSIIGANSLVNKNIPNDVIAVGSPCRVIKQR